MPWRYLLLFCIGGLLTTMTAFQAAARSGYTPVPMTVHVPGAMPLTVPIPGTETGRIPVFLPVLVSMSIASRVPMPVPGPSPAPSPAPTGRGLTDTTYHIFPAAGNTYGYDILINNKLLIHQPAIPGVPGNKGFASMEEAEKVAKLAIRKIKQGMMPPTIQKRELDSLKIKYRL